MFSVNKEINEKVKEIKEKVKEINENILTSQIYML